MTARRIISSLLRTEAGRTKPTYAKLCDAELHAKDKSGGCFEKHPPLVVIANSDE